MVIIAWSRSGSPAAIFDEDVFKNVLSIFITSAFLNFLQGTVDLLYMCIEFLYKSKWRHMLLFTINSFLFIYLFSFLI